MRSVPVFAAAERPFIAFRRNNFAPHDACDAVKNVCRLAAQSNANSLPVCRRRTYFVYSVSGVLLPMKIRNATTFTLFIDEMG